MSRMRSSRRIQMGCLLCGVASSMSWVTTAQAAESSMSFTSSLFGSALVVPSGESIVGNTRRKTDACLKVDRVRQPFKVKGRYP